MQNHPRFLGTLLYACAAGPLRGSRRDFPPSVVVISPMAEASCKQVSLT